MSEPKRIAFVFGEVTLTLDPEDIEAVWADYEREHPGKEARDMAPDDFSKRLLDRVKASARPTRTVIHN